MNESQFLFVYPLFGATVADDVSIGRANLAPTNWKQWSDFDDRDLVEEQAGIAMWASELGIEGGSKPPPILFALEESLEQSALVDLNMELIIFGLRLAGADGFLDPALSVRIINSPPTNTRRIGLYRMYGYSLLAEPADHVDAALASQAEDLATLVAGREALTLLRPLRALYAPGMSADAMAAVALPMLEGIFGRMNRKYGGLYFGERLRSVGVAEDLVDWMESREPGAGRDTRNSLAHGRSVSRQSVDQLVELLRAALVAFLRTEPTADGANPVDRFRRTVWA